MSAKKQELEDFANAIERALQKGKNPTSMVNLVCRLITGKDQKIAAMLAAKWVEWKFGKPKERHEVAGKDGGPMGVKIITTAELPEA